eukprot:736086_1
MSSRFLLALYVYVVYVSFSFQVIVCDATERSISAENYPFILFGATVFSTCSLKHRDRVHHHEYTERSDMYRVYIHQNRSHLPFIYRILPCNFVYFVSIGMYGMYILFIRHSVLECPRMFDRLVRVLDIARHLFAFSETIANNRKHHQALRTGATHVRTISLEELAEKDGIMIVFESNL